MTLPAQGVNYLGKPYQDIGDPLPSIGSRVFALDTGGGYVEGQVTATNPAARSITFTGFSAAIPLPGSTAAQSWTYATLTGAVAPWQSFATTTAVSSNFWFARVGT
jgi:hypothetical protein